LKYFYNLKYFCKKLRGLPVCALAGMFSWFGLMAAAQVRPETSVILISVDTLRADHLSCYGYRGVSTPHIDGLAKGGTVFSQVSAQIPLTLPSHVSLLTSTYPFGNVVEDNIEQLRPGAVTLATVLKANHYQTAAFIGGFVLDRRFGLDQGFDLYDSPFGSLEKPRLDPGNAKRPAEEVVNSALSWLKSSGSQPIFLFVHLYDLHTPYQVPPSSVKESFALTYDGELNYLDEQVGRLIDGLKQDKRFEHSLIALVADHGESLGEHGEATHGYFIYQATLRVPLIFHWPGKSGILPARNDEPAALMDAAPTILQLLGISAPASFQGRSLLPSLRANSTKRNEDIYSESLYAHLHFGTSSLRSLRSGSYKYIDAPKPELYDLARDPGELENLYASHPAVALTLRERLHKVSALSRGANMAGLERALSPELVQRLASLGYVATIDDKSATLTSSQPDPKDRIVLYESFSRALQLASAGRVAEANQLLEQLLTTDPDLPEPRLTLGANLQRLGQYAKSVPHFRMVLASDPRRVIAHFDLGLSYFELGRLDDAVKELQIVLMIAPYYTRAGELLGTIWLQKHEYDQAKEQFDKVLQVDANDYTAHYDLGVLAAMQEKPDEAERHLQASLLTDPSSSEAHNSLGSVYLKQGRMEEARREFVEAVRLRPQFAWAHYNLALVLRSEQREQEAVEEFRKALAADPQFRPAAAALQLLEQKQK
jgi:choline-sulfatase